MAEDVAQWVKTLTSKPDDLSSNLETFMKEGENWLLQVVL